MAGLGSGYDLSVSTFSPDGRVFQVEYAAKAVDNSPLCLAAACNEGVAFAVEKPKGSIMLTPGANTRIYPVTKDIALVFAGLPADGRQIWHRCREESLSYLNTYGVFIPIRILAERIALFMHAYTLYWHVRPFGASCLLAGYQLDPDTGFKQYKGEVYSIDPSGCCSRHYGAAAGQNRPSAKTEMEKINIKERKVDELADELCRIIVQLKGEEGEININNNNNNNNNNNYNYYYNNKIDLDIATIQQDKQGNIYFSLWGPQQLNNSIYKAKQAIQALDSD